MSAIQETTKIPTAHLTAEQTIIASSANELTITMLKILMQEIPLGTNFKTLAEKYTLNKLEEIVKESDVKTQMVYKKLFLTTHEHIKNFSPILQATLAEISTQTANVDAPGEFLGTFVWEKIPLVMNHLKVLAPESLENPEIWA